MVELLTALEVVPYSVDEDVAAGNDDNPYAGLDGQLIDDYRKRHRRQGVLITNFGLRAGQIAYALFLPDIKTPQSVDYASSNPSNKKMIEKWLRSQECIQFLTTRADKPKRCPGMCTLGHAQLASFLLAKDYPKAAINPIVPCRRRDAALEKIITSKSFKDKLKGVNQNVEAVKTVLV